MFQVLNAELKDLNPIQKAFSDVFDPRLFPSERRAKIKLNTNGQFVVDDVVLPYELLPYLFKKVYNSRFTNRPIGPEGRDRYDLHIGEQKFSYIEHENGAQEYLKNDERHCAHGPALSVGREYEYYLNGRLHREDGPAISWGEKQTYALFGETLELEEFVERNPLSNMTAGVRGHSIYIITKWGPYAVINGLDGTKALLKTQLGEASEEEFLIELIARHLEGYKVVKYIKIGNILQPIHQLVHRHKEDWVRSKRVHGAETILNTGDNQMSLLFDRKSKELFISSNKLNKLNQYKIDLSFVDNISINYEEVAEEFVGDPTVGVGFPQSLHQGEFNQPRGDGMVNDNENTGRLTQLSGGLKSGLARGSVRIASGKAAEALAKHMPLKDTLPMEKLTQLVLLIASAEVIERAPDNIASRVGMNEARRLSYGEMTRVLGGEILGRDATKLFAKLAPMLLENLQGVSAEEIEEFAESIEVPTEVEVPVELGL